MPHADKPHEFNPLGSELPEDVVAGFRDQSQLDFDLAFFDHILQRDPDYVDVLRCQGELLTRKGLHERALEIDKRLVALLPEDSVVQYNLACSLALLGQTRRAVDALRRALEFGYDDFDYLLSDADLDSLRDDPAYCALVSKFCPSDEVDSGD